MKYNLVNQMKVKSLGAGKHNDGQGLYLVKRHKQGGKWIQRLTATATRGKMKYKYKTMALGLSVWVIIPALFASMAAYLFSWNFWLFFGMAVGAIALNGLIVALLDD